MKITVTDANIFIDLIKLDLLGQLFGIDYDVYTTKEIVDQLNSQQFEELDTFIQNNQITICPFTSDELVEISQMDAPRSLEFPDKTVVYLALQLQAEVLTGDGPLRKFCIKKNLEVKGIIWLFDVFLEKKLIDRAIALAKMKNLISFNDRIPKEICKSRITQWEDKI